MVLFRLVGWDCLIWIWMFELIKVLINWFLVNVLWILLGVVGYVKLVNCLMVWFNFERVFNGFCFFFLSCILYRLVWLGGENFFCKDLISVL